MKLNFLNYHIFPKIYAKIFKICFQEIFNVTINIYISFLIHLIKTFFNLWQSLNVIIVIYKIHLIISTRVTIHVQKYRGGRLRETLLVLLLRAASSTVNYKS